MLAAGLSRPAQVYRFDYTWAQFISPAKLQAYRPEVEVSPNSTRLVLNGVAKRFPALVSRIWATRKATRDICSVSCTQGQLPKRPSSFQLSFPAYNFLVRDRSRLQSALWDWVKPLNTHFHFSFWIHIHRQTDIPIIKCTWSFHCQLITH